MTTPATILFQVGSTPPNRPTDGKILLFAKDDNIFYQLDDQGIEKPLSGSSTSASTTGVDGGTPTTNYNGTTPINGGSA